jgi:hypothetical protein
MHFVRSVRHGLARADEHPPVTTNHQGTTMRLARLALAALPLALLAACTVNPRPVVVNTPPAAVVATTPATASMGAAGSIVIPMSAMPPAGLCRVWVPGVDPAAQQLPGNCADAASKLPAGGILIRG